MSTVLLIEDDLALRSILHLSLRVASFDVLEATSGEEALVTLVKAQPDLVVLDVQLPGIDGLETLRRLRAFSDVPVVVSTVRDGLHDKVSMFDAGADDYVVKPFEPDELLARVRANLRRTTPSQPPPALVYGKHLRIDLAHHRVTWSGEPVRLSALEIRLLETLVTNRGRLLSHDELLDAVWGERPAEGNTRLRVAIVHLRRKLHDKAALPRLILTEPGLGYRWIASGELDGIWP